MELKKVNKRVARLKLIQRRADVLTRRRIQMVEEERQLKAEERQLASGETPLAEAPVDDLPEADVEPSTEGAEAETPKAKKAKKG